MHPVLAMAIGIVVMMGLIIFTKMHAFPSLIISAILIGILALPFGDVKTLTQVVSTVTGGFGGTMTSIGVVIGFGCIMGIFLEKSGAAKRMALTILKLVGVKNCDYAYCVAAILLFHFTINIGMVIGVMPVIGIPLPFFSYGGSSLWGFTLMLFVLLKLDSTRLER